MKRTDLEKLRGLKIRARLRGTPTPDRFGKASTGSDQGRLGNPLLEKLLGQRSEDQAEPAPDAPPKED